MNNFFHVFAYLFLLASVPYLLYSRTKTDKQIDELAESLVDLYKQEFKEIQKQIASLRQDFNGLITEICDKARNNR